MERHQNGMEYETQLPQAWGTLLRLQEDGVRVLPTRDLEESLRALLTTAKPRRAAAAAKVGGGTHRRSACGVSDPVIGLGVAAPSVAYD